MVLEIKQLEEGGRELWYNFSVAFVYFKTWYAVVNFYDILPAFELINLVLFQALFSIDELESASLAVCQFLASAAAAKRANLGSPISSSMHEAGTR